jgi:hypothetical protein
VEYSHFTKREVKDFKFCEVSLHKGGCSQRYRIMAYLLKAETVEPEKQSLLCNGCVTYNSGVTVGSGVFCAARAKAV